MIERLYEQLPSYFKRDSGVLHLIFWVIVKMFGRFYEEDYPDLIACLSVVNSSGNMLDLWGFLLSTKRLPQEADSNFRRRILTSLRYGRVTKEAIEEKLKLFSHKDQYEIIEHQGGTVVNYDYNEDIDRFLSFIISLNYVLEIHTETNFKAFMALDYGEIDPPMRYKTYVFADPTDSVYERRGLYIFDTFEREAIGGMVGYFNVDVKPAGIKVLHNIIDM